MTRFRTRGLVTQLVIALLLVGVVTALAGALLLRLSAEATLRTAVEDANARTAQRQAIGVDERIQATIETLELLATAAPIVELGDDATHELNVALRVTRRYDALILLDASGEAVAAAASRTLLEPGDVAADPEAVQAVRAEGSAVDLVFGREPSFEIAVAVENPPGTLAGALVAQLPVRDVAGRLGSPLLGGSFGGFLVDDEGRYLVHRERDRVLGDQRFALDEVLSDPDQVTTMEDDGEPTLFAAATTSTFPGAVVIQQEEREAFETIALTIRELTLILLAVVALLIVVASVIGRQVLRPLRGLTDAAERLGRGETDVRAPVAGSGEVRTLAYEFNRMADTLEQRIAELATADQRFQSILDNSVAVMYVKDLDGRYVLVNRQFERQLGLTQQQVVGRHDGELFPPHTAEMLVRNDRVAMEQGGASEVEELVPTQDGTRTFLSVKFPLLDGQGSIYGVCGLATDITDRRRTEEELRRLRDAEQRRHQALELNDTIVQGLTVALYALDLGDDAKVREAVASTLEQARSVIDRLLDETDAPLRAGDLVRSVPATLRRGRRDRR